MQITKPSLYLRQSHIMTHENHTLIEISYRNHTLIGTSSQEISLFNCVYKLFVYIQYQVIKNTRTSNIKI